MHFIKVKTCSGYIEYICIEHISSFGYMGSEYTQIFMQNGEYYNVNGDIIENLLKLIREANIGKVYNL